MNNTLKFLPLLVLYIIIILIFQKNSFGGDESRYVMFATNLSQGYYSPREEIYLWNGPGYPIVLLPFVLFKLPWLAAKLLNALFLFIAVFCFYHTLCFYIHERPALYFSYLLGIYPPFFKHIYHLLTEILSVFLVCGFIFYFCKLHQEDKIRRSHMLIASGFLGYLALTKIFFGYVILTGLLIFATLYLLKRKIVLKKTLLVYLFSLLLCLPYLFYTYSLTGKIFYWGNSGGSSLYWMSTPYEKEFGDWHQARDVFVNQQLRKHKEFFSELKNLDSITKDEKLKERAIQNILHDPTKFVKNWLANIGRLLFNYPYSYTPQKLSTYFYILPNMFLVVLSIICIYPSYRGRKLIPFEIFALMLFALVSFGGSSLLSAYNRQFWPIVPILMLWITFVLTSVIKVEIRK